MYTCLDDNRHPRAFLHIDYLIWNSPKEDETNTNTNIENLLH